MKQNLNYAKKSGNFKLTIAREKHYLRLRPIYEDYIIHHKLQFWERISSKIKSPILVIFLAKTELRVYYLLPQVWVYVEVFPTHHCCWKT